MDNSRRAFNAVALLYGALGTLPAFGQGDAPPDGPVRFVVPFTPGGTADVLARALSTRLSEIYKQSFIVENRPGQGGLLGASSVAKAKPDGSTILLGTIGIHAASAIYSAVSFNPEKELQPIVMLGAVPCVIAVHPSRPFHTLAELIAFAKKHPGELNFGSAGAGSSTHMVGELFEQQAGVKLTHVPYKGSSAAMNDLLGGQLDLMFELVTTAKPFVDAAKIRGLAVTSAKRTPALPNIPTVSELAIPGFDGTGWFTVATTAGTPRPIVNRMNGYINTMLRAPELQEIWKQLALMVIGGSADDAQRYFETERGKWKKVIQTANIRIG